MASKVRDAVLWYQKKVSDLRSFDVSELLCVTLIRFWTDRGFEFF